MKSTCSHEVDKCLWLVARLLRIMSITPGCIPKGLKSSLRTGKPLRNQIPHQPSAEEIGGWQLWGFTIHSVSASAPATKQWVPLHLDLKFLREKIWLICTVTAFFKICSFIFGCAGSLSLFLCAGFLQLWEQGLLSSCSARVSHCGGFSCCGAQTQHAQTSVVVMMGSEVAVLKL